MWRLRALMLATILTVPLASFAETISMVTDRWCPYSCEPESEHPGLIVEIAQKAFAKHNITVSYTVMPWTRAIEETRAHKHTAIVGAAFRDAPDFIFPKVAQGRNRNVFYTKKDSAWQSIDMDSLKSVSLGAIADYSYNDALDAYIAKYKNDRKYVQIVTGDNALESNIKKLLAGRIGALIESEAVMGFTLAKQGGAEVVKNAGALPASENDDLFVAFSPKEPKAKIYAEILAKETKAMRASGELQKILDAYNVRDWQK